MPNWIVRSKLNAPKINTSDVLIRESILLYLEPLLQTRVTIIHAPAGYGKSTALSILRTNLIENNIPVAWLSLDEYADSVFQFLTYLIAACKEGQFANEQDILKLSESISTLPPSEISAALTIGLSKCKGPHVLMLDDLHRVSNPKVIHIIKHLFSSLPNNIHLAISTRELNKVLPIADLRAHDQLIEITQENLRFSESDIREYLKHLVDSDSALKWTEELYKKTEGWPIALQTVRRWLREGLSLSQALKQLSGRSPDLSDYFFEQVFEPAPKEMQQFLMNTSIVKRLNGELANQLSGKDDGWESLQELEGRDMFIQCQDHQRNWYYYHRLFSEFLQERLQRQTNSNIQEIHSRASNWFRDKDLHTEALQHALASKNVVLAADLIDHLGGWYYALQGHVDIVQKVVDQTSDEILKDFPRLWLGKIYLAIRVGEVAKGEKEFEQFRTIYSEKTNCDPVILSEERIMRATLNRYADKPVTEDDIRELELLSETLPHDNHLMHAARCNLLCVMYRDLGRFNECIAVGDRAVSYYREVESLSGEIFIYFQEGCAYLIQARLRDAEILFREAYNLALEHFGEDSDLVAIGSAFLAEVAYEKNRLHEARRFLKLGLPHIERFDAWLEVYVAAYTTAMKIESVQNKQSEINLIVKRAKSTALNRGIPRLHRAIELSYINIHPGTPNYLESLSLDKNTIVDSPNIDNVTHHLEICVLARQFLLVKKYKKATTLLEREISRVCDAGQMRSFITLTVLLAASYWQAGHTNLAIASFEKAVSMAIFEGIKRPFIDEGKLVLDIIRELLASSEGRRGNRLRDPFLAELISEINASNQQAQLTNHILSTREREVLRYLMQGHSNREIAEITALSINTVKFHIKNIYSKLSVSSRKEAVSVAIRQHLI